MLSLCTVLVSIYYVHALNWHPTSLSTVHVSAFSTSMSLSWMYSSFDGNMKNRRDICAASEAGYVQYKSLPGTIKTGCQLSPMRTSKYCFNHAPRVSKVCAQDCTSTSESTGSASEEGIVKVLLVKKVTRNSTLCQVLMVLMLQVII